MLATIFKELKINVDWDGQAPKKKKKHDNMYINVVLMTCALYSKSSESLESHVIH